MVVNIADAVFSSMTDLIYKRAGNVLLTGLANVTD